MNKYVITPVLAIGAALLLNAGSALAAGAPKEVCEQQTCIRLIATAVDSDGDGFTDAVETTFGTDPFNANSHPPVLAVVEDIIDGTVPTFWLEPEFELITSSPDGKPLIPGKDFGLDLPSGTEKVGLVSVGGIDLGKIGDNGLGDVGNGGDPGAGGTTTGPRLPDKPDSGLVGMEWNKTGVNSTWKYPDGTSDSGKGLTATDPNTGDTTSISGSRNYDKDGKFTDGVNTITVTNRWGTVTSSTRTDFTVMPAATAQDAADFNDAADKELADAKRKADKTAAENQKAADAKKTDAQKKADEDKKAADKKKAEEEAEAEAEAGDDEMTDGDYVETNGNPLQGMSDYQIAVAMNAATGGELTRTGNTGVEPTGEGFIAKNDLVVHTDPDAGDFVVINDASFNPDGGQAGPESDPNLPTAGDFQGGVPNQGGTSGAPGDRG